MIPRKLAYKMANPLKCHRRSTHGRHECCWRIHFGPVNVSPQVVKSARVMKNPSPILRPTLEEEKENQAHRPGCSESIDGHRKGDVHDIGKIS